MDRKSHGIVLEACSRSSGPLLLKSLAERIVVFKANTILLHQIVVGELG
jgi:hypothetical protein